MTITFVLVALLGAALFLSAGYSLGRALVDGPASAVSADPSTGLRAELDAERAKTLLLSGRLEVSSTEVTQTHARLEALTKQLETLEEHHAQLVARLATREGALHDAERALAARPAGGFNAHEFARTREALERACDEIVTLRLEKQRGERAELARAALERELSHLRATQVAHATNSRPLRSVAVAEPDLTTTHLNALVERVRVDGEYLAVAVADGQGLAAAGVGERVDELAAFAALVAGLHAQATRYFPMHGFGHTTLTDAQGVTVEARPVPGPHGMVLLTLGATQEWR